MDTLKTPHERVNSDCFSLKVLVYCTSDTYYFFYILIHCYFSTYCLLLFQPLPPYFKLLKSSSLAINILVYLSRRDTFICIFYFASCWIILLLIIILSCNFFHTFFFTPLCPQAFCQFFLFSITLGYTMYLQALVGLWNVTLFTELF